jgi:endonuclease/exonuclease/phosphatase family metal-dependent hydrolase
MHYLLKNAFKWLSLLVVLCTLLALLCPQVNPAEFRWLAFFGTAFPWLILANILLGIGWAWRLNRFALYHLGILFFSWQYITGFFGTDLGRNNAPESAITVATHNLGGIFQGKAGDDALREKKASAYARFLQENGMPDILCTQETSTRFYKLLAQKMGYEHTFNLKKGTVIMSRFPMEAGGDIPLGKTWNSSIWVDIRVGKRLIRVYNLHLQSNSVTRTTEKVIQSGELDEGETWSTIGKVLGKVGNATSIRAEQALLLREHIAACKHPVLVCGDFNDTPNSFVYATLSEGLKDSFKEKGFGLGTTFGGILPFLRIDYILTAPAMHIYSCRAVRDDVFSDHYPVVVELGF